MPLARSNSREAEESLPDPQLNPLINPRLGKNLGRWANVYYTTPPEKRDQAVLELVRELEGSTASVQAANQGELTAQKVVGLRLAAQDEHRAPGPSAHRFCFLCGSPVQKGACGLQHDRKPSPDLGFPSVPTAEPADPGPPLIERESIATEHEKSKHKRQIIFVLLISALLTAWSVQQNRVTPAPQVTSVAASTPPPLPTVPLAIAVVHEPTTVVPARPIARLLPAIRKPSAGKPVECGSEHLRNCPASELYRRTMTLAGGIDALFVAYDKRMSQLTREASRHVSGSTRQRQSRLRQANVSAQIWEHVQLVSYTTHEKNDALRYRAELSRRVNGSRGEKRRLNAYEHPQSCLDLHYIAEDLRRLAAGLPRTQPLARASVNRGIQSPVRGR